MLNSGLTSFHQAGNITTMESVTIKIWSGTLTKLRMIYALTGRPMVEILDRLVSQELRRCKEATK